MSKLNEVDGDEGSNSYVLRPYGLLLAKLGSEELARKACDVLELHMRRFKQWICIEDDGLQFDDGLYEEDFRIINRAVIWYDLGNDSTKQEAAKMLEEAIENARAMTWKRKQLQQSPPPIKLDKERG